MASRRTPKTPTTINRGERNWVTKMIKQYGEEFPQIFPQLGKREQNFITLAKDILGGNVDYARQGGYIVAKNVIMAFSSFLQRQVFCADVNATALKAFNNMAPTYYPPGAAQFNVIQTLATEADIILLAYTKLYNATLEVIQSLGNYNPYIELITDRGVKQYRSLLRDMDSDILIK